MLLYIAPHYGSCSVDGSWPLPTVHSQKSAEAPTIESASKRPKTKGRQTQATHPAHTNPHTANANIRTALFRFLFMKWKTSCTLSDRSRGSWAANRYHIIQRNDISYSMMYYTILYYTILYCTIILYYVIRGNAKRAASFCAANSQDTEPTANACRRNTSLVFVSLFGGKHKQTTREVQSTNRRHKQTTGTLASLSRGLIANTGKRSSTKRSFTARVGEEQDPSGEEDAWEDKPSQHRIGGRRAIVFHWVAGQRLACFFLHDLGHSPEEQDNNKSLQHALASAVSQHRDQESKECCNASLWLPGQRTASAAGPEGSRNSSDFLGRHRYVQSLTNTGVCEKTLLWRRRSLERQALRAPSPGLESSCSHHVIRPRLEKKQVLFTDVSRIRSLESRGEGLKSHTLRAPSPGRAFGNLLSLPLSNCRSNSCTLPIERVFLFRDEILEAGRVMVSSP